jgi:hypothetical protein
MFVCLYCYKQWLLSGTLQGFLRHLSTSSSKSAQILDTSLLLMPAIPRDYDLDSKMGAVNKYTLIKSANSGGGNIILFGSTVRL